MTERTFGAAQESSECEDSTSESQSEDEWFSQRDYELIGRVMLKSSSGQRVQHFIGILDEGQILAIQSMNSSNIIELATAKLQLQSCDTEEGAIID